MKGVQTMINMNEVVAGVTLTKVCSIKADKDSDVSKTINLRVKFDGATLKGVFDKALSGAVIAWQNGVGRKKFDEFKANQVVDITFVSPATTQIDPMESIIASAKAANMTVEEYVLAEMKRRQEQK